MNQTQRLLDTRKPSLMKSVREMQGKSKGILNNDETSEAGSQGRGSGWSRRERKTVVEEEIYLAPVTCQEHGTHYFTQTLQQS